jgi:hypothetical protein
VSRLIRIASQDSTFNRRRHVTRISPQVERAIVSVRRRLEAHATTETYYQRVGAPTVQAELKALPLTPLPGLRSIERILHRHGLTSPRLRSTP